MVPAPNLGLITPCVLLWALPPPGNVPKQAYWPHGSQREAILDRPIASQLPRCEQIWPRATKSIHRLPISRPETPEWAWPSPAESPILPSDPWTFKPLGLCLLSMYHIMVDNWNISLHQFCLLKSLLWPGTVPRILHVLAHLLHSHFSDREPEAERMCDSPRIAKLCLLKESRLQLRQSGSRIHALWSYSMVLLCYCLGWIISLLLKLELKWNVKVSVAQLCPVFFFANPWTVAHQAPLSWDFQARILEWVAMPSSRGSSRPRDWIYVSWVSCISR